MTGRRPPAIQGSMRPAQRLFYSRLHLALLSLSIPRPKPGTRSQSSGRFVRAHNCEAHSVRELVGACLVAGLAGSTCKAIREYSYVEKSPYREKCDGMLAKSNEELVDILQQAERMSPRVAEAMRRIDRALFIPKTDRTQVDYYFGLHATDNPAYLDVPIPIGNQQTISAPHMHATALELLDENLQPGCNVLDVGSGSGYLTAVMGELVGERGRVLGVERHAELARRSVESIEAAAPQLLSGGIVRISRGNALDPALLAEAGPFDAIHVGAAAAHPHMVQVLADNLKPRGRMVIPVGNPNNDDQMLKLVEKGADGGEVIERDLMPVRFVPLYDVPAKRPPAAQAGASKPPPGAGKAEL